METTILQTSVAAILTFMVGMAVSANINPSKDSQDPLDAAVAAVCVAGRHRGCLCLLRQAGPVHRRRGAVRPPLVVSHEPISEDNDRRQFLHCRAARWRSAAALVIQPPGMFAIADAIPRTSPVRPAPRRWPKRRAPRGSRSSRTRLCNAPGASHRMPAAVGAWD